MILDILYDILYLICEEKMFKYFRKGEIVQIIVEWRKCLFCFDLVIDKFCEKIKNYLLESFDKVGNFQLYDVFNMF